MRLSDLYEWVRYGRRAKPRQGMHGSQCWCGHDFNQHGYEPTPDGLGGPPSRCVVPNCDCGLYEPREPYKRPHHRPPR